MNWMRSNTRKCVVADTPQYPAVEVITAPGCCAAVGRLDGQVMLAKEAPSLPLRDCEHPAQCQCRYRKYADRRVGDEDRRFPYEGQRATWYTAAERRGARGRRQDDD